MVLQALDLVAVTLLNVIQTPQITVVEEGKQADRTVVTSAAMVRHKTEVNIEGYIVTAT